MAPKISSPTHPDSNKWYSNNDSKFIWEVSEDIIGVKLLVNQETIVIPTVFYPELITEKQLEDLADGTWYLHAQLQNKFGWGEVSHFKFQIDTTPPNSFEIKVKEGKETTNPQPILFFETTDEPSGMDYYEIKINKEEPIKVEKPEYKLPQRSLGKHTIIVKAVDKAGNYTLAMAEINILPIESPLITDYPKELLPGASLSIKGTARPEVTIKIHFQKGEKEIKVGETKSDKDGKWSYIETEPLEEGTYKVWAETQDWQGAKSEPSEKVTIQVTPPVFIRIGKLAIDYLTIVITFFVFILVLVSGIIWIWQKIRKRRKRLKKEISEAERALYRVFKILKERIKEEVAQLDGKPDLSKREKKVVDNLKEAIDVTEKMIDKEIKDIEEELK